MYRDEDVAERVDKLFQKHMEVHEDLIQWLEEMLEQSDAGGGVEITAETAMELQDVIASAFALARRPARRISRSAEGGVIQWTECSAPWEWPVLVWRR